MTLVIRRLQDPTRSWSSARVAGAALGYPALPQNYLPSRLAQLDRRGDVVRKYNDVANELYDSLISDVRSGRKRTAMVHFRSFADYCLNCLFAAYVADEAELDRKRLPSDLMEALGRLTQHWQVPVSDGQLKKVKNTHQELSQAVHGTVGALMKLDEWAANHYSAIEDVCGSLMEMVKEADRRLNGHRR